MAQVVPLFFRPHVGSGAFAGQVVPLNFGVRRSGFFAQRFHCWPHSVMSVLWARSFPYFSATCR